MPNYTECDFESFLSQLQPTNQSLDFFCDFNKIDQNVQSIKLSLCMLNSLIGAKNLRESVETIWNRDRTAFNVMDILIAVREGNKRFILSSLGTCVPLCSLYNSIDGIMEFLNKTGLEKLFQSEHIHNLVDYVFGIETGLDSNARKNRSGTIMEATIENLLTKKNIPHRDEVYSREWPKIAQVLGNDEKRFDFVIELKDKKYLIEVNFYSGGGSKLNEVARSYSDIAPKINSVDGFEFVWITDEKGWLSAKNKLQEAYKIIPNIYNLTNIHSFLAKIQ